MKAELQHHRSDSTVSLLVIEDERKIREFLRRGLEEEGYSVEVVADGEDGLELASQNSYDLIILDLLLPRRDGIEVCRTLRTRGIATPVLMLTARDAIPDRVAGLDVGADDYLTKPFAFEELLARIRALLRREPVARPTVLRAADLSLDPATHAVTRGGRTVELTTREYQLLYLFMRHPGQILTRRVIEERVWGYDTTVESNVVDAYIRLLRRKIDHGHSTKLVQTVRGTGYVLRV
jgi:DNA-binding response OmpR family regulator